jgi:putative endonuclease
LAKGTEGAVEGPEDASAVNIVSGSSLVYSVCYDFSPMRDGHQYKFWVYIMASPSGTLNTGVTGFFERRITQHKTGAFEGFSKKYGCTRLVYYEGYDEVAKAMGREKQLKGCRREKKIALIEKMNPRWQDLAEHLGRVMLFPGQPLKRTP